jgi:hypothetical protein
MLQTSQRIGNAIGAAVISAVFYASVTSIAASGPDRQAGYGRSYAMGLLVSVGFTLAALAALAVALWDTAREGRAARDDEPEDRPTADAVVGSPPAVALRPDQQ